MSAEVNPQMVVRLDCEEPGCTRYTVLSSHYCEVHLERHLEEIELLWPERRAMLEEEDRLSALLPRVDDGE